MNTDYWNNATLESYKLAIQDAGRAIGVDDMLAQAKPEFWRVFYYDADTRPSPSVAAADFRSNRVAYQVRGAYRVTNRRVGPKQLMTLDRSDNTILNSGGAILIPAALIAFSVFAINSIGLAALAKMVFGIVFIDAITYVAYMEWAEDFATTD